jgi:hypothetical protein
MATEDRLATQAVGAAEAAVSVAPVEAGGWSVCSVCGRAVAEGDIENSNGWRWYSDGRGGLHTLCASCPAPSSLSSYYE